MFKLPSVATSVVIGLALIAGPIAASGQEPAKPVADHAADSKAISELNDTLI